MGFDLLYILAQQSQIFHSACLDLIPPTLQSAALQWAFVCGHPLDNSAYKTTFQSFGVMHLLVVSGSHLVWIEILLRKLFRAKRVSLIFLLFYCAICLWQPPVVRAWLQMAFRAVSERLGLNWSATRLTITSGVVLMMLIPHWIESMSFHMSLIASIAIAFRPQTPLRSHILVILLMYPLTLALYPISPTTLFASFLITPILSIVLFPLTLLGLVVSPLQIFVDQVWIFTLHTMNGIESEFITVSPIPQIPFWIRFTYCLFILGVLWNFGFSKDRSNSAVLS